VDRKEKADRPQDDPPKTVTRRPWRAPQFVLTEVASTYAQGNAHTDGHGVAPSSS